VAGTADAAVVGYMLVFAHHCAYDGEEFRFFVGHIREPFLYVDQLAIDPQHRRAGIGGQLYAALREHAIARQVARLCCEVNTAPPNPASLAFHVRQGFTAVGDGDTLDGRRVAYLIRSV
jgi:predicted GNAT superfamily acetyltransferase